MAGGAKRVTIYNHLLATKKPSHAQFGQPHPPRQCRGRQLYDELLARLTAHGCHLALGGIALPNPGSIGLHEALGFRQVACFNQVGYKFGQWVDVGYWQKILGNAT